MQSSYLVLGLPLVYAFGGSQDIVPVGSLYGLCFGSWRQIQPSFIVDYML